MLTNTFLGILQSLPQVLTQYLKTDHGRFLPHPFQFVIHNRPIILTFRNLRNWKGDVILLKNCLRQR